MTMASIKEVTLIINKDASRASHKLSILETSAKKAGIPSIVCKGKDIVSTIEEVLKTKSVHRLLVAGGDGTVAAAASLISRSNRAIELGVLPAGTANYYAKSLGLNRITTKSVKRLIEGATTPRHLCRIDGERDFLIGMNVGVTSRMFSEVSDDEKKRLGRVAYFRGIFRSFISGTPPDLIVEANGTVETYASTELVVMNHYIHEPIQFIPKVEGSEPYFEVITYGLGKSKLSPLFAAMVYALTLGRNQRYLKRIKTTKAVISSISPLPVSVDGDSGLQTPVTIELVKKPVQFVKV